MIPRVRLALRELLQSVEPPSVLLALLVLLLPLALPPARLAMLARIFLHCKKIYLFNYIK
jgi:hypothetical protein